MGKPAHVEHRSDLRGPVGWARIDRFWCQIALLGEVLPASSRAWFTPSTHEAYDATVDDQTGQPLVEQAHSSYWDEDTPLGTATGFAVARQDRHYLITNRHVVSGRHWETDERRIP